MKYINDYFATARERYRITLKRRAGQPKPWTDDPIYREWKFCSVHREDDRTTIWFRENVRQHVSGIDAVKATVAFRWFNRVETAERITDFLLDPTSWRRDAVHNRLKDVKPVVTGAYIILGAQGMSKLDGVLQCIEWAFDEIDRSGGFGDYGGTLQGAWKWFSDGRIPYLGPFMAYEIVSDLRWTNVLSDASDIMTWANAGPGCARGLGRMMAGDMRHFNVGSRRDQAAMQGIMQEIVNVYAKDERFWPQDWPHWEMREAEHWSCEFDKYMRIREGGRMKNKYPGDV